MVDYVVTQRAPSRMRARTREASLLRRLDWVLLATVVAIVGYGLWAIDGITKLDVTGDPDYYVTRQAAYALLGAVGLIVAVLIDPQLYRRHSKIVYGGMIAMLLLVPLIGVEVRNTRRWIELGSFQFQPSEFGKLLVILFLAASVVDPACMGTANGAAMRCRW